MIDSEIINSILSGNRTDFHNNNDGVCDNHQETQVSEGNAYRHGLAWIRGNSQGYRNGQGFRPGAGKHLYGQGNCVVNE